jgi:hypothetical protein
MLIDVLDKLADRLLQLTKEKEQHSDNLFSRFVDPVYSDFEMVHVDYVNSFESYREMVLKEPKILLEPTHLIFEKIRTDSLRSQHHRHRIGAIQSLELPKQLEEFRRSICRYIRFSMVDRFLSPDAQIEVYKDGQEGHVALWFEDPNENIWLQIQIEARLRTSIMMLNDYLANQGRLHLFKKLVAASASNQSWEEKARGLLRDIDSIQACMARNHAKVAQEYMKLKQAYAEGLKV